MFSIKRILKWSVRTQVKHALKPIKRVEIIRTTSSIDLQQDTSTKVLSGTCHVIDGDTIVIGNQKIRFAGMNAPELNEPYGKQAKWALVVLCKGQIITAYPTGNTSIFGCQKLLDNPLMIILATY